MFKPIINDHPILYLQDNDFSCVQQLGFMQCRSTCLQLLNVSNDLMEAWKSNIKVDIIYLDFVKAFDTVPHERLLHKISRHGIKDQIHGWIGSVFSNRSQCVMINGCKSESVTVTSGIPQGSICGPLSFVIYINCPDTSIVHTSSIGQLQANPLVVGPRVSSGKSTQRAKTTMGSNDLVVSEDH